jgi:hypothetical protein
MTEPQIPSAERTQLDKLGTYIFENVPGAPLRAHGIAEQAIEIIAAQRRAIAELAIAIQLTVEYVGYDTLPPQLGWSWYDALAKHDPALLRQMHADMRANDADTREVRTHDGRQIEVGPHEFQRLSRWLHRDKCRACYWPRSAHPIHAYVAARPIGDTSGFVTPP